MLKKSKLLKPSTKEKPKDVSAALRAQVAANIKIFRKRAGLTQEQLSKKTKVSARYIAELERSGGQNLTLDTLSRLSDALFVQVSDLINGPQPLAKRKIDSIKVAIESLNNYCRILESVEDTRPEPDAKTASDNQKPEKTKTHWRSRRK